MLDYRSAHKVNTILLQQQWKRNMLCVMELPVFKLDGGVHLRIEAQEGPPLPQLHQLWSLPSLSDAVNAHVEHAKQGKSSVALPI